MIANSMFPQSTFKKISFQIFASCCMSWRCIIVAHIKEEISCIVAKMTVYDSANTSYTTRSENYAEFCFEIAKFPDKIFT